MNKWLELANFSVVTIIKAEQVVKYNCLKALEYNQSS